VFRRQPLRVGVLREPSPIGWLHTLGFGLPPKTGVIDDRARVRERLLPSVPVRLPLFFAMYDPCDDGDHFPRTTATATIAAVSRADHDAGVYGKRDAMRVATLTRANARERGTL
jgi:hypothetical protein